MGGELEGRGEKKHVRDGCAIVNIRENRHTKKKEQTVRQNGHPAGTVHGVSREFRAWKILKEEEDVRDGCAIVNFRENPDNN